jgi:hypothetical protein
VTTGRYDELRHEAERARVDARDAWHAARRRAEEIAARLDALRDRGLHDPPAEAGDRDPGEAVDRYDAVRNEAERARADAQAAIDVAMRRADEVTAYVRELRGGRLADRSADRAGRWGANDGFAALKSAHDRERRAHERSARAHDRAAREHDRLAECYEVRDDDPGAVRERAAGVRERQAAEQARRAAKQTS